MSSAQRGGQIAQSDSDHGLSDRELIELNDFVESSERQQFGPSSASEGAENKTEIDMIEDTEPLLASGSRSPSYSKEHADDAVSSRRTSVPDGLIKDEDVVDWTDDEERQLIWKIDRLVMPLLIMAFFALQLDRGNIGNAMTDYFLDDVGITQGQFNIGNQLMSFGIVALEIPSNMILYRIGPSLWLSCQIVAWGTVAALQALQHGVAAYWSTRLLLGLCESGFIPAALFTITRWYKTSEISKRYSIFFVGNTSAQAISSIAAYGLLQLRGVFGLAGWQWLFIIEGLFTIAVGLIFVSFFPRSPHDPTSLTGHVFFTRREQHVLVRRVLIDDPSKRHAREDIPWSDVKAVLCDWKLLPHFIFTIVCLAPMSTLAANGPTLIASMGYERLLSNAIWSLGQWLLLILTVANGYAADMIGLRGPVVLFGGVALLVLVSTCRALIYSENNTARLVFLLLTYGFGHPWHPTNGSWMALNSRSAGQRSITMAIFIMAGNLSGVLGGQLFQADDAPFYPRGWTYFVAWITLGVICMLIANIQYPLLNRRAMRISGREQYRTYSY